MQVMQKESLQCDADVFFRYGILPLQAYRWKCGVFHLGVGRFYFLSFVWSWELEIERGSACVAVAPVSRTWMDHLCFKLWVSWLGQSSLEVSTSPFIQQLFLECSCWHGI